MAFLHFGYSTVSRWEPTSQIGSTCSYRWGKLELNVRNVTGLNCATTQDRDENAAKIIDKVGMGNRHDSKRTQRKRQRTSLPDFSEVSRITAPLGG